MTRLTELLDGIIQTAVSEMLAHNHQIERQILGNYGVRYLDMLPEERRVAEMLARSLAREIGPIIRQQVRDLHTYGKVLTEEERRAIQTEETPET